MSAAPPVTLTNGLTEQVSMATTAHKLERSQQRFQRFPTHYLPGNNVRRRASIAQLQSFVRLTCGTCQHAAAPNTNRASRDPG